MLRGQASPMQRDSHPQWKGGRVRMGAGYVGVHTPGHPRADGKGYVMEHLLVAERALGRPVPRGVDVHHFDEDKTNNVPGNLVICEDHAYHMLLHRRQRALEACGNPSAHRCKYCGGYEDQSDITVENLKAGHFSAYHRRCNARYQQSRKEKRS